MEARLLPHLPLSVVLRQVREMIRAGYDPMVFLDGGLIDDDGIRFYDVDRWKE